MDIINNNILTGHISGRVGSLDRALGQYLRYYGDFKIGITGDPEKRGYDYVKDGWSKMVLLYFTGSENYIRMAETLLVKYGWKNYFDRSWNEIRGGWTTW